MKPHRPTVAYRRARHQPPRRAGKRPAAYTPAGGLDNLSTTKPASGRAGGPVHMTDILPEAIRGMFDGGGNLERPTK